MPPPPPPPAAPPSGPVIDVTQTTGTIQHWPVAGATPELPTIPTPTPTPPHPMVPASIPSSQPGGGASTSSSPTTGTASRRNVTAVSILNMIQQGIGILGQLNQLAPGRNTPAAILAQTTGSPNLVSYQQQLPALPGGGSITGGGFTTRSGGGSMPMQGPPSGYHWAKDGSGRIVRNRHMNPLNASAARRAIRRIKGARRMLRSIESSLPKRAAPRTSSTRRK
jgi:hypothetical protein